VTGLAILDTYVFGASATNAAGTSALSAPSGFVIPVSMTMGGQVGIAQFVDQGLLGLPEVQRQTPQDGWLQAVGVSQPAVRRVRGVRRTTEPVAPGAEQRPRLPASL
jgi:hypothetical protein